MANLKQDHSYLYKRVRLKAIMFTAIGLLLTFLPSELGATQRNSALLSNVPFLILGAIYLLIAAGIVAGLFRSRYDYGFARGALTAAALYSTFWVVLFIAVVFAQPSQGTFWALVMYTYFTYNIWLVVQDPGWKAIQITKDIISDTKRS